MFFDLLLVVCDWLLIVYMGCSICDNVLLLFVVFVDELFDYLVFVMVGFDVVLDVVEVVWCVFIVEYLL